MIKIGAFLELSWCCRFRVNRSFRILIDKNILNRISDVDGDQLYNSEGFRSLLPFLVGMKTLSLKNCAWLDDKHLSDLGKSCPTLQTLDLSGCENISDYGIEVLAQGCSDLRAVDLTFCSQTTYTCVLTLIDLCGPEVVVGPQFYTLISAVPFITHQLLLTQVRRQPAWLDGHFECPWTPPEVAASHLAIRAPPLLRPHSASSAGVAGTHVLLRRELPVLAIGAGVTEGKVMR